MDVGGWVWVARVRQTVIVNVPAISGGWLMDGGALLVFIGGTSDRCCYGCWWYGSLCWATADHAVCMLPMTLKLMLASAGVDELQVVAGYLCLTWSLLQASVDAGCC